MKKLSDISFGSWLLGVVVLIIALMPFHATLTIGLSAIFGHYTVFRLWKECLLIATVIVGVIWVIRDRSRLAFFLKHPLTRPILLLISIYILLHIVTGLTALFRDDVTTKALGYGLISNLRYLVFFVVCLLVGSYHKEWVAKHWQKLLLMPAGLVVAFGLLQASVLPIDALKHIGYGPDTIAPYITVDEKLDYARVQSTLRGPNPLGAYLVLIITVLVAILLYTRKHTKRLAVGVMLVGTVFVLYATYSRSAYIGAVLAVAVLVWCLATSWKIKKLLLIGTLAVVLLGAGTVFVLRDNDHLQNVLFHTDEHSQSMASSNESRAGVMLDGVEDVAEQPYGRGPGTAGPASVHNHDGTNRISENYFIQVAQEVGVIGIGLFLAICIFVGRALWLVRKWSVLPIILLASLVGLSLVNFISHAWADDTIAYVWWGIAGLTIGASIMSATTKQARSHGKKAV